MSLIRCRNNQSDPLQELFAGEHPLFGLSLLPRLDRTVGSWAPAIDVSEDTGAVHVKADLPGIKKEDITVSLENGILTIRGERKTEAEKEEKNFHRSERFYGVFERRLDLGTAIDEAKVAANYKDGVLELTLPKSPVAKPKQISIN